MIYIAVDPSGSFTEGKGHTGISTIKDWDWDTLEIKSISAKDFGDRYTYWKTIIGYIIDRAVFVDNSIVVIESYVVRNNGFSIGKMPETSLFIGALIWELERWNVKYVFQSPSQAKTRFKDDLICRYIPNFEKRGNYYYLNDVKTNDHIRDSLKHLLYFMKYGERKIK